MMKKEKSNQQVESLEEMKNIENLEYAVQMARWLLRPLGLWPVGSSTYSSVLRWLSILICTFLLAFRFLPNLLYIFLVEKDLKKRLRLIGPLSFSVMNICKYVGILAQRRELASHVGTMALDYARTGDPLERGLMLENARAARTFTAICAIFMYGGGLPFTIIMPIVRGTTRVGNLTYRHFAYPGYYVFFDPQAHPNYEIVYSIHCLCGVVTYTVTCALCSIAILCVLHICGQIAVTAEMLRKLATTEASGMKTGQFDRSYFGRIVRKHIRSLRFASKLESMLTGMCLVELVGCTFNICMLGYYFITEFENSETLSALVYTLLLVSLTFNIFIFCYIGELLTERCRSLGKVAYMINWHEFTARDAKNVIPVIALTYRPIALTAGKLVTLSLQSFCNVLKISVSYLNILRTLIANAN